MQADGHGEMGRQKDTKVHSGRKDMQWIVRKGIFWDRQAAEHSGTSRYWDIEKTAGRRA
jgi:hypothetical protein